MSVKFDYLFSIAGYFNISHQLTLGVLYLLCDWDVYKTSCSASTADILKRFKVTGVICLQQS